MEERTCDIIVLGGGPAGMTAAIYAKRANLDVVLLVFILDVPENL